MTDERQDAGNRSEGPRPEPIRFFGTTWLDHSGGYALRRVGLAVGSLLAAGAGAFVLLFAYQGLAVADAGSFLDILLVVAFALCSVLAFRRTLLNFTRRPEVPVDAAAERSMRSIRGIGFVGVLLAYFLRSLVEAPGEKLRRAEYQQARAAYERRRAQRTGNPAGKRRSAKRGTKR